MSAWLDQPQSFTYNHRSYELLLRPERYYLPFSLHLIEFRHDKYPGTDIPKNFSSRVRLQNLDNGEDREVRIFMNNPLRYAGETFYQASFDPDDHGSVLQVVHNPSWLTPYFSCVLVAAGLVIQFSQPPDSLLETPDGRARNPRCPAGGQRHSGRTDGRRAPVGFQEGEKVIMKKWIPLILVVVMAGWALSGLYQPPETGFDTRAFGKLPVLMNGRFQPFDSVARNSLLQIRAKQTVLTEENGKSRTMSAMDWLLEAMMKPESADDRKVFRIDNNEVTELLKLPDGQKFYSFNQLRPQVDEIGKAGRPHRATGLLQTHRLRVAIDEALRGHEPVSAARSQPQTAGFGRFCGGTGCLPEEHRAGHRRRECPGRRPEIRPGRLQHPARFHGRLQYRRQLCPAADHSARGPRPAARRLAEHRHQSHADRAHRRNQPGDEILCRDGHRLSRRRSRPISTARSPNTTPGWRTVLRRR